MTFNIMYKIHAQQIDSAYHPVIRKFYMWLWDLYDCKNSHMYENKEHWKSNWMFTMDQ